ncbi:MAG TPA: polymer-forming cytoskeletal protein [Bryobacteraceae bacterium]|nr:polymer-forming cytoskeletal protein [Bryobacteraceae bacterium]
MAILLGALTVLACGAGAQELDPGVRLLARIKDHMREELSQIPNYTCLETIVRFRKAPGRGAKLQPADTVRLEIVYSDHKEWYGSPGDRKLSSDDPAGFVGSGMIGTGSFATTLHNLFQTTGATFTYRGEETLGNRSAARYDFHWPRWMGGFEVSIFGGTGTVGERGSFWADPQSLDLIRLESAADEIPPFLLLQELRSSMNYARMRIGEYSALLAQQADTDMLKTTGEESYDRLEFTHCRAFTAESAIRFGTGADDGAKQPAQDSDASVRGTASASIPALLKVTVRLASTITEKDAVGTLIEGRVMGDVLRKGKVVIANDAVVRGRIRRLERYQGGQDWIVGLEFTEVEASAGAVPFYGDLLQMDPLPGLRPTLSEQVPVNPAGQFQVTPETVTLPELPGVASFFVHGKTFTLSSGVRMIWRTRGPLR